MFEIHPKYRFHGVPISPDIDRQNEKLTPGAIKKAMDDYIKNPLVHYQHSEIAVGVITDYEMQKDGSVFINGALFDTPDVEKVWQEIQDKTLNKMSLYGMRKSGSPSCKVSPAHRGSPCVVDDFKLWSISLVGNNAVNQSTWLKPHMKKGFTDFEYTIPLIYDETNTTVMAKRGDSDDMMKGSSGEELPLHAESNISGIVGRLTQVEATLRELVDSDAKVHAESNLQKQPTVDEQVSKADDQDELNGKTAGAPEDELEKCDDTGSQMMHAVADKDIVAPLGGKEHTSSQPPYNYTPDGLGPQETGLKKCPGGKRMTKTDVPNDPQNDTPNPALKKADEEDHSLGFEEMKKAFSTEIEEMKKSFGETIAKFEPLVAEHAELKKSFEEYKTATDTKMGEMGELVIRKSGNVVIIPDELQKADAGSAVTRAQLFAE